MAHALEMRGIVKRYPGVLALDCVDFTLEPGEVHCLVGENGAGKSTLMKILSGAVQKDGGTITVGGREAAIDSPGASMALGIGMIYQDFKLVPELTVAENMLLGSEPIVGGGGIVSRWAGLVDRQAMHRAAAQALAQLGEPIPTDAVVGHLSVARQQVVEIAKAISRNVRILAMDEPTAPLSDREIASLFDTIRRLKAEGVSVIYISHRLEEIFAIGDRVTVLRDGKVVATCPVGEADRRKLIRWMVGREIEQEYPYEQRTRGEEILRIAHLSSPRLRDVNLSLHRGEILGLGGLVGSGRTELARALFGADPVSEGQVALGGKVIAPRSPHEAIDAGIALLTEDRNRFGLITQMNVRENISLASLSEMLAGPFISQRKEAEATQRLLGDLHIRPADPGMPVEHLSGGNRQKVVLARWLITKAKVLIFDEPTAGIDVGVKYEIYTLINRLAREGIGVLVISSDLPELLGICDRIAVMCEGSISGVLERRDATPEKVMSLATGGVEGGEPGQNVRDRGSQPRTTHE